MVRQPQKLLEVVLEYQEEVYRMEYLNYLYSNIGQGYS